MLGLLVLGLASCEQAMRDQPRHEPMERSAFFEDGQSGRERIAGTVARGQLQSDRHRFTGAVDGRAAATFPFPLTREDLLRGRERYEIYCAPCHDSVGAGRGTVVRRGFPAPPSLHEERLRRAPVGHFFEVMTNGLGRMPDYRELVTADDRWRIAAYVRALQRSQRARWADVPEEERRRLP